MTTYFTEISAGTLTPTPPGGEHIVQFYETDEFLVSTVGEYMIAGLEAGEPCIVIATTAHRGGLEERLQAAGVDLPAAIAAGRYVALDALELLASFRHDGVLVGDAVHATLGAIIDQVGRGGRCVRIFGEMVALLCADGDYAGAQQLEEFWNELQRRYSFSLFCGYPMGSFAGEPLAAPLAGLCAAHTRVIPAESYAGLTSEAERSRAIALLQQKAYTLEAEIAERKRIEAVLTATAVENARLYQQAQDAIRLRDEFLIAVSHDLRTPLTVIQGHTQLLRRRYAPQSADASRMLDCLESIERRTRMMATVIDELVDATRLQAGEDITLDREPVDLTAMVSDLAAGHQQSTGRHTIELAVGDAEIIGLWDRVRLMRVIGNLLSNAVKYSPHGGTIAVQVAREAAAHESWAIVAVSDQGLGIPAADLPHIFERFYRARNVRGETAGTGIGLATARHIVERHGGTITVSSEEGAGTRFIVRLPISGEDAA
jgi:signal transduction histidine kinase